MLACSPDIVSIMTLAGEEQNSPAWLDQSLQSEITTAAPSAASRRAMACPTLSMTSSAVRPAAHEAFSHSRI